MPKVIFDVPAPKDRRWKFWRKAIDAVNTSVSNGYAFGGRFLAPGRKAELPIGTFVLTYDEVGNRRYHDPDVALYQISASGHLEPVRDDQGVVRAEGASWALELRDRVARLMGQEVETVSGEQMDPNLAVLLRDVVAWGRGVGMPEEMATRINEALGEAAQQAASRGRAGRTAS